MALDQESFKNFTSAVSNIAMVVAVIIGGIWSLHVFRVLEKEATAEAELIALRESLQRRAIVHLSISANSREFRGKNYILGQITIKNDGNRHEVVNWRPESLLIQKIDLSSGERLIIEPVHLSKVYASYHLSPQEKDVISFITEVPETGIYSLRAEAELTHLEELVASQKDPDISALFISSSLFEIVE